MTRAERLKAALAELVEERRVEIDALRSVRVIEFTLVFDDAGLVDTVQVSYQTPKQRMRPARQRCVA